MEGLLSSGPTPSSFLLDTKNLCTCTPEQSLSLIVTHYIGVPTSLEPDITDSSQDDQDDQGSENEQKPVWVSANPSQKSLTKVAYNR